MDLFAFGINHTTAPVDVRERVGFAQERLPVALQDLVSQTGVQEAAILSTCNRTDLYCALGGNGGERAIEWFHDYHRLPAINIRPYLYIHRSEQAVRHIIRVASGLDSMILGEPQILGQVKEAYRTAHASGTVGRLLSRLFQHTFSVAKQVRTDTAIGANPVSVAFAATTLARQIFGDLGERTALLVGAGETIELAARHLCKAGLTRMIVANRTLANAQKLASQFGGFAISLEAIGQHLGTADIVVSSTGAHHTVISRAQVEAAIASRKRRPVFMCDIAVPRDIEADVSDLEDVYLYTVDDLQDVIQDNLRSRKEAASQAETIIDSQVSELMGWLGSRNAVPLIRQLRTHATDTRDEVLDKAFAQLASGKSPEDAMRFLANTLTNKLMHHPTSALRSAGASGREDLLDAAEDIFGIPPSSQKND
jgi:glutamyl-tRNA reductase